MVLTDSHQKERIRYEPVITNEPVYCEIPLSSLKIKHEYQREQNSQFDKWVNNTVETFDPDLLGVLMVADENGQYFVWDGQGRLEVLKRLGFTSTWCQISDADERRQAELFGQQVNRRNLTWTDRHKAAIIEGNPVSLDIEIIANEYGYSVGRGSNNIRAVGALYWIYDRGGYDLLNDVLRTISTCWGETREGLSDRAMKGLGFFYNAFPASVVDRDEAIVVFNDVSPGQVLGEAAKMAQTTSGSNSASEFARILMKKFNKKLGRRLHSKPIKKANDLRITRWERSAERALANGFDQAWEKVSV